MFELVAVVDVNVFFAVDVDVVVAGIVVIAVVRTGNKRGALTVIVVGDCVGDNDIMIMMVVVVMPVMVAKMTMIPLDNYSDNSNNSNNSSNNNNNNNNNN